MKVYLAVYINLLFCYCSNGHADKKSIQNQEASLPGADSIIYKANPVNSEKKETFKNITNWRDVNFIKDSTINGNIILLNPKSIERSLGDLSRNMQEYPNEGTGVTIRNISNNEYLKMLHLPGSVRNDFMFFEVGHLDSLTANQQTIASNIMEFTTESGISLGITIDSLKKFKGRMYTLNEVQNTRIIEYTVDNGGLFYSATYYFKGGQLVKFGFGYTILK